MMITSSGTGDEGGILEGECESADLPPDAQPLGVVHVLVTGESAVDGLAEEGAQAVLRVPAGAGVVQARRGRGGQSRASSSSR